MKKKMPMDCFIYEGMADFTETYQPKTAEQVSKLTDLAAGPGGMTGSVLGRAFPEWDVMGDFTDAFKKAKPASDPIAAQGFNRAARRLLKKSNLTEAQISRAAELLGQCGPSEDGQDVAVALPMSASVAVEACFGKNGHPVADSMSCLHARF